MVATSLETLASYVLQASITALARISSLAVQRMSYRKEYIAFIASCLAAHVSLPSFHWLEFLHKLLMVLFNND